MRRSMILAVACMALSGGAVIASACSSDDTEAAPSRPPVTPVDDSGGGGDGGGGDGGGGEDAACTGEAGCFSCDPMQNVDFLNECTDDLCTPFDNVARLPLYVAGQPLPAIP